MALKIQRDDSRFREIVHRKIKPELHKYITHPEFIGKQGRDLISIPLPQIEIPHFRYGQRGSGGVGQGEGKIGTPIAPGQGGPGGGAGSGPGIRTREVEVSVDEMLDLIEKRIELPFIEPKGRKNVKEEKHKYTKIAEAGPESLVHFKRTYKRALKRQIGSSDYDPAHPKVIPIRRDKLYRHWTVIQIPEANAVIILMMDISGSMQHEQREIVRITAYWLEKLISRKYDGTEVAHVIHDDHAEEVDRDTFYHSSGKGGTRISTSYKLAREMIRTKHKTSDKNVFVFHFTDGDNWGEDNTLALQTLRELIKEDHINRFCYGQVESDYGQGKFYNELQHFQDGLKEDEDRIALALLPDKETILDAIITYLSVNSEPLVQAAAARAKAAVGSGI